MSLKRQNIIIGLSLFFVTLSSCMVNVHKSPKNNTLENLSILRQAGFFDNYSALTDQDLFDTIHQHRIQEFSGYYKEYYDPGMNMDIMELAAYDKTKCIFLDLEADVCAENLVYTDVIKQYDLIGLDDFNPINITEVWESETGPIHISFDENNKHYEFEPAYQDDWLHESVFKTCEDIIKEKGNLRLLFCLGDDGYGYGQQVAIMRLTKSEQEVLEEKLKWTFE